MLQPIIRFPGQGHAWLIAAYLCGYVALDWISYLYPVAEARGVKMPRFIGYMAWSTAILLPLFALLTGLFII